MYDGLDGTVEGDMNVPTIASSNNFGGKEFNTLDEPISETVVSFERSAHGNFILNTFISSHGRYK